MSIRKILIANRGEIAVRVMRTCREMGITTVAVYSDSDRSALHTRFADQALYLGADPATQSYLKGDRIIELAKQVGADAIHPGFGFLSENARFAQAVQEAGLCFIGPQPRSIDLMGRKDKAKVLAQEAGVPTLPGYHGDDQNPKRLELEAGRIGWPLLIKASAGGGGKGMAIVERPADFSRMLEKAKAEAQSSFGDSHVLLERFFPTARHIEVQVFGDKSGKIVHLFERECSVQRRHQKIIEETPSASLTPELREKICESGVKMARRVDYENAGTVEFIFDSQSQQYFFLEMNTRLQVKHPVTEMVTGLDLVRLQIEVADGKNLPFEQADLVKRGQRGHALEVRLYAEDPKEGFRPSPGSVHLFDPSQADARIESGLKPQDVISPFYDPMVAKIITHAATREEAIAKMEGVLRRVRFWGPPSNLYLLHHWMAGSLLKENGFHTRTVDEKFPRWTPDLVVQDYASMAAIELLLAWDEVGLPGGFRNVPATPRGTSGSQTSPHPAGALAFDFEGQTCQIHFRRLGEQTFEVQGKTYRVTERSVLTSKLSTSVGMSLCSSAPLGGPSQTGPAPILWVRLCLDVAGQSREAQIGKLQSSTVGGEEFFVHPQGGVGAALRLLPAVALGSSGGGKGDYRSPMPGKITRILVKKGDRVAKGARLMVVEAMKMENEICAYEDGVIQEVLVAAQEQVTTGTPLLQLKGDKND